MNKIKNLLIVVLAFFSIPLTAQEKIELTWQVVGTQNPKYIEVAAYYNKVFTIDWGDGCIDTITGFGIYPPFNEYTHNYTTQGEYFVIIETTDPECYFIYFSCNNQNISNLVLTGCSSLTEFYCEGNHLTKLDLSGLNNLMYLNCTNNHLTELDLSNLYGLMRLQCSFNQLKVLNFETNSLLALLWCSDNQLKELDLSGIPNLYNFTCSRNQITKLILPKNASFSFLYCSDNLLTSLDLSTCDVKYGIECYNNQFQLSTLFTAHSFINQPDFKKIGTQIVPTKWVHLDAELFAEHSVFNGIFTKYIVEKEGIPAQENEYSVIDGKLTFHTLGIYTVTMTNDAIVSHPDYPAQVITTLEVVSVAVNENELSDIKAYPNPTQGKLQVTGYELQVTSIEVFDIYGRNQTPHTTYLAPHTSLDITDLASGVYFVKIYTESGIVTKKILKQ